MDETSEKLFKLLADRVQFILVTEMANRQILQTMKLLLIDAEVVDSDLLKGAMLVSADNLDRKSRIGGYDEHGMETFAAAADSVRQFANNDEDPLLKVVD